MNDTAALLVIAFISGTGFGFLLCAFAISKEK